VEYAADHVAETIAYHSAERPGDEKLDKRIRAEKTAVGHSTRDEKGNIAFDSTESKNGVNAVLLDDL
jgi:hypothetical protein